MITIGFAGGPASMAETPRQPRDSASPSFDGFALISVLCLCLPYVHREALTRLAGVCMTNITEFGHCSAPDG